MNKKGCIQVYTGNGKGKTTAAFGLGLRAWGQGRKVCVVQFMKKRPISGECMAVKKLGRRFLVKKFGTGEFVGCKLCEGDIKEARKALEFTKNIFKKKLYSVVILDEINCALKCSLVKSSDLKEIMRMKPEDTELILTGRYAPSWLLKTADLITEMKDKKHYFSKKIKARCGIEY